MKKILSLNLVAVMVFVLFGLVVSAQSVSAEDCEIPESGPWPACATGGGMATAPASSSATACVIPESGPWPPCATADTGAARSAAASSGTSTDACPIPESGPWPPCATAGAASSGAAASSGGAAASGEAAAGGAAQSSDSGTASSRMASAPGTRTFNLQQVRSMMTGVMNEAFTGNAACTGNQCFESETNVTIEDGTIRMTAFTTPSGSAADVKIDLLMRVSAENGEAKIELIRLTRNRIVATPADQLESLSMRASSLFDQRLEAELGASAFDSVSATNGAMMVSYR